MSSATTPMMTRAERQFIVVADAGPLIRLAAAGLLGWLRGLNRRIVLVDRVEDEIIGDRTKRFAMELAAWIDGMGEAILRVRTVVGVGIEALRARERTPEDDTLLRGALRDSGEQALREFVGRWQPTEASSVVVLYEDRRVATLFLDADFPVTLMTTRAFVQTLVAWGVNVDAGARLEAVADRYELKPALVGEIDPDTPVDLRTLPQPI
ncbi:MAG TPA: hypothetical protein VIL65_13215 [Beijerinckiaceae bacterium]